MMFDQLIEKIKNQISGGDGMDAHGYKQASPIEGDQWEDMYQPIGFSEDLFQPSFSTNPDEKYPTGPVLYDPESLLRPARKPSANVAATPTTMNQEQSQPPTGVQTDSGSLSSMIDNVFGDETSEVEKKVRERIQQMSTGTPSEEFKSAAGSTIKAVKKFFKWQIIYLGAIMLTAILSVQATGTQFDTLLTGIGAALVGFFPFFIIYSVFRVYKAIRST